MSDRNGWDYIAIAPITFEGARAYNIGDPVHVDCVTRHGYLEDGLVAAIDGGSESASAAVSDPHTADDASSGVDLQKADGEPDPVV